MMSTSVAVSGDGEPRVAAMLAQPEDGAHLVDFYDEDEQLVERVAHYLAAGVRAGEPTIAVATAAHLEAFARRMAAGGVDAGAALASGAVVMLDADATLEALLVDGQPSAARFRDRVLAVIDRARGGRGARGGARIRAYGEMVDLLWRRGDHHAALRLEELWCELGRELPMVLLCAYAMGGYYRASEREPFEAVCRLHTAVVPTERCAGIATTSSQLRELSMLELRSRAFEHELGRRAALEAELRDALAREVHAREEAERTVRFNDMFVRMLGHDLRNPLGAISMGASYIARNSGHEKMTRAAARILASTGRMSSMVEQLLDFSRIRLGRGLPIHPIRIDLAELCARVKAEIEALHPGCEIALAQDGCAVGTWDHDRLSRVFANVIGNAVSYSAPGSAVTIRIEGRDPARVAAQVHNAGAIAPETLATLFEPFRVARRQHQTHGLGLGLFITREVVRVHGGAVDVASSEEHGTTIRICLPRGAPGAGDAAP